MGESQKVFITLNIYLLIFIYLAAPSLSCDIQDL